MSILFARVPYSFCIRVRALPFYMSRSPEPKRDESSLSPPKLDDENIGSAPIQITVHSVMAGLKDVTITVPADATVGKLKRIISIISDVPTEQQILVFKDKVLSNENATLSSYGMIMACTITMNLKMNTGSRKQEKTRAAEMMLFLPLLLMPKDDVNDLRGTIREMTDVKS
ncbi:unnamed protein product [Cylicocyclus nassatus]|uniref:Ubiquitin-like domain-containing protein n=1 Tax=Cylicocyclus nassatus TaxID=53992 RepID=A0AA36GTU8_CYLNA|nr:unnamed protein product [Cylicocyclus nassatus]